MSLIVQIKTILFSFLYGVFFHFILDINYKYITRKGFFSIFFTLLFIVINVFVYCLFTNVETFCCTNFSELLIIRSSDNLGKLAVFYKKENELIFFFNKTALLRYNSCSV